MHTHTHIHTHPHTHTHTHTHPHTHTHTHTHIHTLTHTHTHRSKVGNKTMQTEDRIYGRCVTVRMRYSAELPLACFQVVTSLTKRASYLLCKLYIHLHNFVPLYYQLAFSNPQIHTNTIPKTICSFFIVISLPHVSAVHSTAIGYTIQIRKGKVCCSRDFSVTTNLM
jgi:hypothetical protein